VKAAYASLKEAEHRSTFLLPYWNIPILGSGPYSIVPRQREFAANLQLLNDKLDELVVQARSLKKEEDLEALEKRDYSTIEDPSMLRFLIDIRGGDCEDKQLRDDLMTLLIAGHETTGSLLTWTAFELAQNKDEMHKIQKELDDVLQGRAPTLADIKNLHHTRMALSEGLRLYPQPPILLRRVLTETELPRAQNGDQGLENGMPIQAEGVKLNPGANIFISVWNLHRNPLLWEDPDKFKPSRWLSKQVSQGHPTWEGYSPKESGLYPNEVDSDFGYIPFGGGQRKCVGDQFAMMEAVVILSKVLQKYDLNLVGEPEDVGMATGATIHTANGLRMKLVARNL